MRSSLLRPDGRLALTSVLSLALLLRAAMAVSVPFMHDEYGWAEVTDSISLKANDVHLPLDGGSHAHPPAQAYWNRIGVLLLGKNALGYRLASILMGTGAVGLMYLLGRTYWSAPVGLLAAALLSLNEYHLGITHTCTQKSYLTFALLFLYLYERAIERPRLVTFVILGLVAGLGGLTGLTFFLWVPVIFAESLSRSETRRVWRTAGPYVGIGVCLTLLAPYVIHEFARAETTDISFQASKSSFGEWSWGPMALYIRPLYYLAVEGSISEYPSMTTIAGSVLLTGTVLGVLILRSRRSRLVQVLGFFPFVYFSLFSRPTGEFFWSDFSLPPFILLTSALAFRVGRWSRLVVGALVLVFAWKAVPLVTARERYFPLDWGGPPSIVIEQYRFGQRTLIARWKDRDHVELSKIGAWRTPLFSYYRESLALYREAVVSVSEHRRIPRGVRMWTPDSERARLTEARWAEAEMRRFELADKNSWATEAPGEASWKLSLVASRNLCPSSRFGKERNRKSLPTFGDRRLSGTGEVVWPPAATHGQ